MDKIIWRDGKAFKQVKNGWRVKIWESKDKALVTMADGVMKTWDTSCLRGPVGGWKGTGQREVRITRRLLTVPLDYDAERHLWDAMDDEGKDWNLDIDIRDLEQRAERSRKKSGQRAKTMCRLKIKHGGFRHMLTGTYRENQTDFNQMRRDFAAWLRKMRATVKKFRSVYAFEPQKRGAWHFHAACDALPRFLRYKGVWKPSYEVCTLLWQDVVGDCQFDFCGPLQPGQEWPVAMVSGGTINVDGHTKKNRKKLHADARSFSLAKMAGYVSKYLTKHVDKGLFGRQMWGSTEDLTPPKPITLEFGEQSIYDIISVAFECPAGHRVVRHWMNEWEDCWVLDTEPIPA